MNILEALVNEFNTVEEAIAAAYKNEFVDFEKNTKRYRNESICLELLAAYQLNVPKNKVKRNFENMNLTTIFKEFQDEVQELHKELYFTDEINFQRAFEELGDCAAMLVGLFAKLMAIRKKQTQFDE